MGKTIIVMIGFSRLSYLTDPILYHQIWGIIMKDGKPHKQNKKHNSIPTNNPTNIINKKHNNKPNKTKNITAY